ncbi:MAG: FMN-binding protein [Acidothermus sp.]|nr:FMN-binding protein [Acidothermus sp.]MCL6537295.1 FMN-binding protein [Acidothermus sp.]
MRRAILALVATAVGLVLLLQFKTVSATRTSALSAGLPRTAESEGAGASAAPQTSAGGSGATGSSNHTATSTPTPSQPSSTGSSGRTQTVLGQPVVASEGFRTFGTVQVQLVVVNGKITDVQAVDYPHRDPRSYEISQYAIPVLRQEVLAAQGANIDAVSGATWTSEAYAQSVQSALDQLKRG